MTEPEVDPPGIKGREEAIPVNSLRLMIMLQAYLFWTGAVEI